MTFLKEVFSYGLGILLACGTTAIADEPPKLADYDILTHAVSDKVGKKPFTFRPDDFSADSSKRSELPIGVFDSGIGGLTILEAILNSDNFDNETLKAGPDGRPDFENESFIYFGDQANMPYGNYSAEERTATLREHIIKDAVFLLGRRYWKSPNTNAPNFDKPPVKAIVIACNTATAYGLGDIRAACKTWGIPMHVIGVVEAGATGLKSIWKEKQNEALAVFATVGTCSSGAYPRLVQSTLGRAGYGPAVITQQGSISLAGVLEGAPGFRKMSIEKVIQEDIEKLLKGYQKEVAGIPNPKPIGSVMLGCTHFPLAKKKIDLAFDYWKNWRAPDGTKPYATLVSEKRVFIDPATWTAKELFRNLTKDQIRNRSGKPPTKNLFFLSVPNPDSPSVKLEQDGNSFTYDYKYGRSPNHLEREDTKNTPLIFKDLPESGRHLILSKLPAVAKAIGAR